MYSYGSSARIGVGKRGHGGRNYRPPKPKNNDPSVLVPPPLKACNCMIQLDITEYAELAPEIQQQRRRLHLCFEGRTINERRKSLADTEKALRLGFGVHLVVPGRNQKGPLAVVGKTIREALPAVDYFMQQLVLGNNTSNASPTNFLTGRIMRNVKDPNAVVLVGRFRQQPRQNESLSEENHNEDIFRLQPYWLFESNSWNAMVCPLSLPPNPIGDTPTPDNNDEGNSQTPVEQEQKAISEALQIGFDNLRFRIGNAALSALDIFLHPPPGTMNMPPKAFATGDPSNNSIHELYRELGQTRVALPKAAPVSEE